MVKCTIWNDIDLRTDPTLLLPGCKSIIVLSLNYDQPKVKFKPNSPKISKYAVGKDYHKVIKDKSKQLIAYMRNLYGDIQIRGFVDSGPVMERSWAEKIPLTFILKGVPIIFYAAYLRTLNLNIHNLLRIIAGLAKDVSKLVRQAPYIRMVICWMPLSAFLILP